MLRASLAMVVAVACLGASVPRTSDLPGWAAVEAIVARNLAEIPHYRPGDILSRQYVAAAFAELRGQGWSVAHERAILAAVPADNELLVRDLRTKDGRKFMRQVKGYPDAYSRLDRLIRLPYGRSTVERLIAGPDGYKMIEYMTETPYGANMGDQISNAPKGRAFNKSTGRIYTESELFEALLSAYVDAGGTRP